MINVIVGQNASGKTLYLNNKCLGAKALVTNLPGYGCTYETFSQSRLTVLETFTTGDVVVNKDMVTVVGGFFQFSLDLTKYVSLLCSDGDLLVLDEPDLYMEDDEEITLLYNLIKELGSTYTESCVATHAGNLAFFQEAQIMTVKGGKLVPMSSRDAYEMSL